MHTITWLLDGVVTLLFAGMVLLIILLVFLRYLSGTTIIGGYELLRFSFIYTTFLGAAILLDRREHIGMGIVVKHIPEAGRKIIDIINHLLILAFHIYLIILSVQWISVTGSIPSPELKLPMKFIQCILPIGCVLASVYSINNIVDDFVGTDRKVAAK